MSAVVIATLVVTGLLVGALATFLIWVVGILVSIDRSLGQVTANVEKIAEGTASFSPALNDVNSDLRAVADTFESLAAKTTGTASPATAS